MLKVMLLIHNSFVLYSNDTTDLVIYPANYSSTPHGISITHVDGTWLPGYPLRIESIYANSFLSPFFNKHINKEMFSLYRDDSFPCFDEFDWNLFDRDGFIAMLDDIQLLIDLLSAGEFDNLLIREIALRFVSHLLDPQVRFSQCITTKLRLLKANTDEVISYYRDFSSAIKKLMDVNPDCNWFCIQGP